MKPLFPGGNAGRPGAVEGPAIFALQDRQASPTDTPQSVKFSPSSSALFSCVSWDQKLRLYAVNGPQAVSKSAEVALGQFPLSQAWNSAANGCFVSLSDGTLVHVDLATQTSSKIAASPAPLLQVANYARGNFLVAIDNDKKLVVYAGGGPKAAPDFSLKLPEQPFGFVISGDTMLLYLARSKIAFLHLQAINQYSWGEPALIDSQLAAPISAAYLDDQAKEYCLASVDGRAYKGVYNIEALFGGSKPRFSATHSATDNARNFTFLAQSKKRADNTSDLFCVSCLGGNPRSRQFLYTAGSDGVLTFWDLKERNKIGAYSAPGPVNCCDVSPDGQLIALGLGYDWSQGVWGLPDAGALPAVAVKKILDGELSYSAKV